MLNLLKIDLRDALIIAAISSTLALAINFVHPNAIPFIAAEPYQTLVPCPVSGGEVHTLQADDARLSLTTSFLIDARSPEEFEISHFPRAQNITYDYLDATPPEILKQLAKTIAQSRAQQVIVYGDGDDPDTGHELGKEISGHGIKNIFYIQGGAPVLLKTKEEQP